MKVLKTKAVATFMGVPGSSGFVHEGKYRLKIRFYNDGSVIVSSGLIGSLGCSYGSLSSFFMNWKIDRWR